MGASAFETALPCPCLSGMGRIVLKLVVLARAVLTRVVLVGMTTMPLAARRLTTALRETTVRTILVVERLGTRR